MADINMTKERDIGKTITAYFFSQAGFLQSAIYGNLIAVPAHAKSPHIDDVGLFFSLSLFLFVTPV